MKTLGVLLLLVACVSSGFAHQEKVHKKKDPAIHAIWISHNKRTSYLKLDDGTYIEYFTSEKEKFNRYKALVETKSGYTILKPLNDKHDFYLAIGKSKVLYQEKTFKNIEKHGVVESSGYWIKLDKASHSKSKSKSKHSKSNSKSKHSKPKHSKSKHSKSKHSKSKHSKSKHSDSDSHSKESKKCSKSQCHEDPCKDKCSTNKTLKCVRDCHECTAKWTYKKKDVTCQVADNNEQVKWIGTYLGGRVVYERVEGTKWRKVETGVADVNYVRVSSIIDSNGYLKITLQGASDAVVLSQGSIMIGPTIATVASISGPTGTGYWADENKNILPSPKADSHAQVKWTSSDNLNEYIQISADSWILYINKVFISVYTKVTTPTYDKDGYLELVLFRASPAEYVKLLQGKSFDGATATNIVNPTKDGYWENKFGNPISRPKDGKHNIVRWQEVDDTFEFIKISQDKTGDIWIKYVNGNFYARYQRLSSSKDKHLKKGQYPTLDLKDVNNEEYVRLTEGKAYQGTHVNNVKTDLAHGFWADKYGNFVSHPDNSNSKSKSKSHHSKSKSHHSKSKSHHSKSNSHSKSHSKSKESKKCHHCPNKDPCKKAKCHANKHAKCRNDCHKCRATWYYDHKKVSCDKKVHKKESHSSGSDSKSHHYY